MRACSDASRELSCSGRSQAPCPQIWPHQLLSARNQRPANIPVTVRVLEVAQVVPPARRLSLFRELLFPRRHHLRLRPLVSLATSLSPRRNSRANAKSLKQSCSRHFSRHSIVLQSNAMTASCFTTET